MLSYIVYPFSILVTLLAAATVLLCLRFYKLSALILWVVLGAVVVAGSPLSTELFLQHEQQYLPVSIQNTPTADAIVVLGGSVGLPIKPRTNSQLNGNRLLHAYRLYNANKAPIIVISGGNVFEQVGVESEAYYISEILKDWGISSEQIIVEGQSRNTYENAVRTKKLMESRQIDRILLVTSSFHMPRAIATFKTLGINAVPSPSEFSTVDYSRPAILDWMPSLGNFGKIHAVIHEKIGILVYRYRGWIA